MTDEIENMLQMDSMTISPATEEVVQENSEQEAIHFTADAPEEPVQPDDVAGESDTANVDDIVTVTIPRSTDIDISVLLSVHEYVVDNIDKLTNSVLINDNILALDNTVDVINSLIFNEQTKHKIIVFDCTNLYMPETTTISELGDLIKMTACQSGIIMTYAYGKIYATKNNLFVINEVDGKVSNITIYYRAKKGKVSFTVESVNVIDPTDIDLLKIQLKSRCVRVYASTQSLTDIDEIRSKFMAHYAKVVDINNLIKIEYLRRTIGC